MMRILSVYILILILSAIDVAAQNKSVTVTFTTDAIVGSNPNYNAGKVVPDSMNFGGIVINSTNASFGISGSDTYRFYISGTTTVSALFGNITNIEFEFQTKKEGAFNNPNVGKYSNGKWTGNAQSVKLTTSKTGWVKKIVVTYNSSDTTLVGDGSVTEPFSVKDAVTLVNAKVNTDVLQQTYVNVKGFVSSILSEEDEIKKQETCYYSIVDSIGSQDSLVVNAGCYLNNEDFISSNQLVKGDKVMICGKLSSSQGSQSGSMTTELVSGNYIAQFWGNDLTVDERNEKNEITADMRHATVKLYRTFSAKAWNSLVLPFDMTAEQVKQTFGEKIKLANYVGTTQNEDGTFTLNFKTATTITANIPVFVYGANDVDMTLEDVGVVKALATHVPSDAVFAFTGSYDKITLQANDWFISSDNKFYLAAGTETMKATRAVFRPVKTGITPQSLKSNLVDRPTSIAYVNVDALSASDSSIYNLAGQRVSENYHGIVIKRGKKYLKR